MMTAGDGKLRLPAQSFALGGVLVDRANKFLADRPGAEDAVRRVLTLRLATVREDGEPTRRRAFRSEFSDGEWRAGQRTRRPPQSPTDHRDHGGRRDLRRCGARGDIPALGQAARLDRCRARIPGLAKQPRSCAARLAGGAGAFEERRGAHGPGAGAGSEMAG